MRFFDTRRVRVLPEFARLYPEITPGTWVRASKAALWIWQADAERQREHACARGRAICDVHFEFRGGTRGMGIWLPRTPRRLPATAHQPHRGPEHGDGRRDPRPAAPVPGRARVLSGMAKHYPSLGDGNWYLVLDRNRQALEPNARDGHIWISVNGRPRHVCAAHFEVQDLGGG
jgi:hypothetical protein